MLRLGLLLGFAAGAIAMALLSEPKDGELDLDGPEPSSPIDKVKRQFRLAQRAAREEKAAKEAEMMAEYEHVREAAERHEGHDHS